MVLAARFSGARSTARRCSARSFSASAITASSLARACRRYRGGSTAFTSGRHLAAWLGLVPRQATTGGKAKLLGIGKRGSKYLRKMLVHGARSALPHLAGGGTGLGRWIAALRGRAHVNTAVVALANKLARIAWAVLRRGGTFEAGAAVAPA